MKTTVTFGGMELEVECSGFEVVVNKEAVTFPPFGTLVLEGELELIPDGEPLDPRVN